MSRVVALFAGLLALVAWSPQADPAPPAPEKRVAVIEVKMVDEGAAQWRFVPDHVRAQPGSIVRFVMDDIVPHNVEFRELPDGTDLRNSKMGPFLLQKGQTYDVVIDERFALGEHHFVCTPHEMLGMVGTIEVVSDRP